jgi:hypothetical protein
MECQCLRKPPGILPAANTHAGPLHKLHSALTKHHHKRSHAVPLLLKTGVQHPLIIEVESLDCDWQAGQHHPVVDQRQHQRVHYQRFEGAAVAGYEQLELEFF